MATSFNSRLSTAPEEGCKAPCVTVSLTNITLSGEQTIGVTAVVTGDRVLVAGQTDSAENGIWVCNSGVWTRAKDWNTAEDVAPGMLIPVSATEELYQTKPFTGAYNPGITEVTFGVGILSARSVEAQTGSQAVSGLFTLTTTTYTPGANNLEVDHNGQRLNITTDYTEPSASTVQIVPARVINPDDIFTFRTNTTVSNSVTVTTAITHTRGGVTHNLATYLDGFVMEFDTMALALASTKIYEGATLLVKDLINSTWDAVLSSGVTENTYNIRQCTGVPTLSLVYRPENYVEIVACGAVDGAVSNGAIQAAIDLAVSESMICMDSTGGTFLLNRGTTGVQGEAVDLAYPAVTSRSNMIIIGVPYQTRFKIADNQSSNGSPYNVPTLFSNVALENIYLYGIEFDGNQANNDLNEVAHGWTQFGFSGSPTASSIAKGDNVHIEMCRFLNNPGATNIGMSQSENTSGTVGKKWRIKNCDFYYNGYKCHDHSSIYGFADDVEITGCDFDNPDMFGTSTLSGVAVGGTVAYELHGADHHFHHNRINNYDQVSWIATNKISPSITGRLHDNTSRTRDTGYAFYRESVDETVIRDMDVYENTIELTDHATAVDLKAAFRVSSAYKIESARFKNNNVIKEGTNENACMAAIGSATVAGQKHTDIIIDDNDCKGTCYGTYVSTNATNGLGRITHTNNRIKDLADTAAFTETAGIIVNLVGTNTIDSLTLGGNDYKGTAGEPFDRGTYLYAGTITDLHYRGDSHEQMAIANYDEGSCTITNKHGDFPTLAYTPVWKAGSSTITIGNGTNNGYYTKKKDQCTVVTKLVFGTTTAFTGSGTINVSLPITAATAGIKYIGDFTVIDGGTTRYQGQAIIDGTGTVAAFERDGGTFLTDTSPISITNTDELYVQVTYRVAD